MTTEREPLPPPPIEALPDVAWARVERAVLAGLDAPEPRRAAPPARRRFALGLAIAATAVAAAALGVALWPRAPEHPAVVGEPSRVVTGDTASEVAFGDAHVTVAPASALVLDGAADHGVLAVLERGSARFVVAPRRSRPPFVIQAGGVGVRVVGTELTVTRLGPDDAAVEVHEGVVEVTHRGHTSRVAAGERWTSRPTETAALPAPPADPEPTVAAPPAPPAPPARRPPAPRPPRTSPEPAPPAATADRQAAFEAAAALEATDPASAIAKYRELARGRDAWAGNALYALGRLARDRGDLALARDALTAYVHRFPRGANIADARSLLATLQGAP